ESTSTRRAPGRRAHRVAGLGCPPSASVLPVPKRYGSGPDWPVRGRPLQRVSALLVTAVDVHLTVDLVEHAFDLAAQRLHGDDRDDGDEHQDQGVLDEALALELILVDVEAVQGLDVLDHFNPPMMNEYRIKRLELMHSGTRDLDPET